ncbi:MAG: UDP-N-acetylmuramate dehydrogenase [Oscillospiraceae bacterium]|nr:UDP-N-acetylmuramate dehydrogenase [Oscillospiraceae bacterium]
MFNKLYDFSKKLGCSAYLNEPLDKHSSFKIGGKSKIFIEPVDLESLKNIIIFCKDNNIKNIIIGNGSNILFRDEGFDGAVIKLGQKFEEIKIKNKTQIFASAGVSLSKLAYFAMENSLSGLEFCWGIPGNVGGAVFMNAGAFGSEIKDVIINSDYININNNIINQGKLSRDEMELGYRTSAYMKNNFIITGALFSLSLGEKSKIKATMDEYMIKRKSKQPLEFPNAGSIFKRPKNNFAGTLIQNCGLKGKSIGGAQVSEKHAGFIINKNNATSKDVIDLISFVRQEVFNKTGFDLEPEIRII